MIGKNIYRIRIQKGLSLSELAERANISKSYLSTIERNLTDNPSIHVMDKLAKVLDVELKTLLTAGSAKDNEQPMEMESEWIEFINDLKESGIEKEQIQEYKKSMIEFIKWKKFNDYKKIPGQQLISEDINK